MTHSPAEWAQMVSLAFAIWGALSVPYFIAVDADLADFNPRPALETGRLAPAYQVAVHAGHDLNRAIATTQRTAHRAAVRARHIPRDTAITAAALLSLTIPTGDHR